MKPDNTQETIYVGLDTGLPPYLPYPRFLLKMDISQTAKLLYALLFGGFTLNPLRPLAVALCRVAVKPEKRLALWEIGFFGLAAFSAVQQTVLACVVAAVRLGIRQQIDIHDFVHKLSPSVQV